MENRIKLIKERLTEITQTVHSVDRLKQRLDGIRNEMNPSHYNIIVNSLEQVRSIDFPENKSYAINLDPIMPNKESSSIVNVDGRIYFRVMGDNFIKDSTGNQFWVIIRGNKIITAMLRKDVQTRDINYNKAKLDVDVIFNRVSHIKKL